MTAWICATAEEGGQRRAQGALQDPAQRRISDKVLYLQTCCLLKTPQNHNKRQFPLEHVLLTKIRSFPTSCSFKSPFLNLMIIIDNLDGIIACCGCSMRVVGCSAATLISTHYTPGVLPTYTSFPRMPPDIANVLWGAKQPLLEKH